jgi:chromosome segregation ATPase
MGAILRLLSAIGYYGSFKFLWGSEQIRRAADRQFTSSAEGVGMAFDLHQQDLVKNFNELRNAIAQVEGVLEDQRQQLASLNEEETKLLGRREGALSKFEAANAAGNAAEATQHQEAFDRFDGRIQEIESQQADLESRIKQQEGAMKGHFARLTKMQAEIQKLPAEKAKAIADFVSNNKIVELSDRLNGIQDSLNRGPIDAVLSHNRELSAKARIADKMAGANVAVQDAMYDEAGQQSTSSDRMRAMLAARKAEKSVATGEAAPTEKAERPNI